MATVPVTRTFTAGEVVLASYFNANIRDVLNFLLAAPQCRVRQTVAQSIPNATNTALTFGTEDVDVSGMHSTVTNTSRLTAVYPGWYTTGGGPSFAANVTGVRIGDLGLNGTGVNGSRTNVLAASTGGSCVPLRADRIFMNVSDYIEILAFQNSGAALNTATNTTEQSSFNCGFFSN